MADAGCRNRPASTSFILNSACRVPFFNTLLDGHLTYPETRDTCTRLRPFESLS